MHTDFLTKAGYRAMGLRCGLEVHQQLRTRHKLFCKCPNEAYTNHYDAEILRHMRPTLSEMGEYDRTALMEYRTRKEIIYRLHRDRVCTYEIDDAPPFGLNQEALDIAIEISLLLHCNIVSEIHIARKQYLDGSIPTGFQRTMIVGLDGWFPVGDRKIRVRQVSLEEDACREVSDEGHIRTYYTDRLCIPLIEVVTDPDFRTPEEAAEGAEVIRRCTRVTGKVRRGAGATRQDTNVSVSGGDRVEIKGVSSIHIVPQLVHWEGIRQRALIEIATILSNRGLTEEHFGNEWREVTDLMRMSRFKPIRQAVADGHTVYAVRLPRFRGILEHSLGNARAFVDELRDRVRVVACLDSEPNLLYSEDTSPSIAHRIWQRVNSLVEADQNDAVLLVWGPQRDAVTACEEIVWRSRDALVGVVPDTRQVRTSGATRFERVLAGPNRMYPDTDMPPVAIAPERLVRIRASLPAPPWERYRVLTEKYGLPHDAADALILTGRADLYLRIVEEIGAPARVASHILTNVFRRLQRRWQSPEDIPEETLLEFFRHYAEGGLTRETAVDVLARLSRKPGTSLEAALEGLPSRRLATPKELDRVIVPMLEEERDLLMSRPRFKATAIAMGVVMPEVRGCCAGKEIQARVEAWLDAQEDAQ